MPNTGHLRNAAERALKRHVKTQQLKESPTVGDQNSAIVYRRRRSSEEVSAMLGKTYQSSDRIFHHGWFVLKTEASKTFYVVDDHTREIQQAVRICLFSDMSTEERSRYQKLVSHWHEDSALHGKVKSNAAANLGGGSMYAAGWRAGYERYQNENHAGQQDHATSRVSAAYVLW